METIRIFFKWWLVGYVCTWAAASALFAILIIGAPLITWEVETSLIIIKGFIKINTLKTISGVGVIIAFTTSWVMLRD